MALRVEIVSPQKHLFPASAKMVVARTTEGDIAFEPGHIPFAGVLLPGRVKVILENGSAQHMAVHSGFVEISHNDVSILSDVAELAHEIDVARAQEALAKAQTTLASDSQDSSAKEALIRAQVRLNVAAETP